MGHHGLGLFPTMQWVLLVPPEMALGLNNLHVFILNNLPWVESTSFLHYICCTQTIFTRLDPVQNTIHTRNSDMNLPAVSFSIVPGVAKSLSEWIVGTPILQYQLLPFGVTNGRGPLHCRHWSPDRKRR